jgi:hypothetical protein
MGLPSIDLMSQLISLSEVLLAKPDLHRGITLGGVSAPFSYTFAKCLFRVSVSTETFRGRGDLCMRALNVRKLLDEIEIDFLLAPA